MFQVSVSTLEQLVLGPEESVVVTLTVKPLVEGNVTIAGEREGEEEEEGREREREKKKKEKKIYNLFVVFCKTLQLKRVGYGSY